MWIKKTGILWGFFAGAGLILALGALFAFGQRPAEIPSHRPSPNINSNSDVRVRGSGNRRGGKPTVTAWQDDFNGTALDTTRWINANEQAPGYLPGKHIGYYDPTHLRVLNGYLVISLTQENGTVDGLPGAISRGGLIYTKNTYGYGTYEWRVRMSSTATSPTGAGSPVSGSVSAGFNYINNSQTEIDFEFSAHQPGWLWMVNWYNTKPATGPYDSQHTYSMASVPDLTSAFHTYKFVWQSGKITYSINDLFQTSHVTDVPTAPAYFMINHWGTNNPWWGGAATVGTTRYFYIDWARYTPL